MNQLPAHQANTSSSYSGQIGTGEYHRPQESWLNLQTFIYALDIGKSMIKVVKIRWLERALFFTYRSCSLMVAGRWEGSLGSFYNGTNPVHQTSTFKSCFIVQRPHLPVPSHIARNFNQNYVEGIQLISHNGVIWGRHWWWIYFWVPKAQRHQGHLRAACHVHSHTDVMC